MFESEGLTSQSLDGQPVALWTLLTVELSQLYCWNGETLRELLTGTQEGVAVKDRAPLSSSKQLAVAYDRRVKLAGKYWQRLPLIADHPFLGAALGNELASQRLLPSSH